MRKSLCSLFLMALISSVLWLSPATAQVDRGSIVGTVKDSTNAVLPGARVQLQQKGPSAVSDVQGQFMISNLLPGSYTLEVSYVGFAPFETSVTVAAGQIAHVDAILQIGTQSQAVTVNGD